MITQKDLKTFRKFTLTSGYNPDNTKFVKVSTGESVGADPLTLKGAYGPRNHHVKYEGFLYGCFPGWVMATTKGGCRGWSEIVQLDDNVYTVFNPFREDGLNQVQIHLSPDGTELAVVRTDASRPLRDIGTYSTVFGVVKVKATLFKGLRFFMSRIQQHPKWATVHLNGVSFNEDYTRKYDNGLITEGQFDPLDEFKLHQIEYCEVDRSNILVKTSEGRYLTLQKSSFSLTEEDRIFLWNKGVKILEGATGRYDGDAYIPSNSEYETTEEQWSLFTKKKKVKTGLAHIEQFPSRPLHPLEGTLINKAGGYINLQYLKESIGLGTATNGGMRDERAYVFSSRSRKEERTERVYSALLSEATAKMLCNLIHVNVIDFYQNKRLLYWDWMFEHERLLGTFLTVCMEQGQDMAALWEEALQLQPEDLIDWINSNIN